MRATVYRKLQLNIWTPGDIGDVEITVPPMIDTTVNLTATRAAQEP